MIIQLNLYFRQDHSYTVLGQIIIPKWMRIWVHIEIQTGRV
jgi:hypothetical protein